MLNIFIAFIVMAIICLIIARAHKDGRIYTQLMLGVCLGFIVGATVKYKTTSVSENNTQEITTHPTVQSPVSSVVWNDTVTFCEPSKDLNECDTIFPAKKCPTNPRNHEIQDDS